MDGWLQFEPMSGLGTKRRGKMAPVVASRRCLGEGVYDWHERESLVCGWGVWGERAVTVTRIRDLT